MIRYLLSIGFAFALFLITFILLIPTVEFWFLENWLEVQPLPGVRQMTWLNDFSNTALYCAVIALVSTIFWHSFGYYFYKIKNWRAAGGRIAWLLIFIVMLIVILVFGWLYTEPTQDLGKHLASGFYLLNAIFIYIFSSLVLSPATVKYAPVGSTLFAPIGNGVMRLFYRS